MVSLATPSMHISESPITEFPSIQTKCTNMTEDQRSRHGDVGVNGVDSGSPSSAKETNNSVRSAFGSHGGRLKFFKDGKFILELERTREGERMSWVSVPRKTFWPPTGPAVTSASTLRQETNTSLSVSDDNSSVQSSPWQRDHSWKQLTPKRNQSKEMSMMFWRCSKDRFKDRKCLILARRPYCTTTVSLLDNGSTTIRRKGMCNNTKKRRSALVKIIQKLKEATKVATPPPRPPHPSSSLDSYVSPRKRFLREIEKDAKQHSDEGLQKRSRNRTPQVIGPNNAAPAVAGNSFSPATDNHPHQQQQQHLVQQVNGSSPDEIKTNKTNSSYSITALLAEEKNVKRSSPNHSPSHYNSGGSSVPTTYCSPSTDERWYTESVDRLRSIELSQADKRRYHPAYSRHPAYLPAFMYAPYSLPPYYSSPGIYGHNYMVSPMYHQPISSLQMHRQNTPSCSWTVTDPVKKNCENKDDSVEDMPLNLSKNSSSSS